VYDRQLVHTCQCPHKAQSLAVPCTSASVPRCWADYCYVYCTAQRRAVEGEFFFLHVLHESPHPRAVNVYAGLVILQSCRVGPPLVWLPLSLRRPTFAHRVAAGARAGAGAPPSVGRRSPVTQWLKLFAVCPRPCRRWRVSFRTVMCAYRRSQYELQRMGKVPCSVHQIRQRTHIVCVLCGSACSCVGYRHPDPRNGHRHPALNGRHHCSQRRPCPVSGDRRE
jgi:hypothetical protein